MANNIKVPVGIGIGIGVTAVWLLVELWPLAVIGGAAYMVVKGLEDDYTDCQENNQ